MARIRTIKPDFWTDEKVVELSAFARLLFIGLWNFADDEGRMVYSEKKIKMQIFPGDTLNMSELFGEIRRKKLVEVYNIENVEYLQIVGFEKHQKIDKRSSSKLPPSPNIPPESPRIPPTEGKGREEDQGREVSDVVNACKAESDFKKVFDHGSDLFPGLMAKNTCEIHKWISAGCDLEADILQTLKASAGRDVGSWSYFSKAIMNAKATREKPLPEGKAHENFSASYPNSSRPNKQQRLHDAVKNAAIAGGFAFGEGSFSQATLVPDDNAKLSIAEGIRQGT